MQPLLNGASVVIVPENVKEDMTKLADFIVSSNITNMFLTTRLFNLLTDNVPECFEGLRVLSTGGEAASVKHFKKASNYVGGSLYNVYGPTETAVMVTAFSAENIGSFDNVHIGKPNPSRKLYVLDRNHQLLPIGMVGELFIGGGLEFNGYISNEELSAERFISDPFDVDKKIYATGDFVKLSSNGDVIFVGRKDFQVKVRGFRIELGEIENAAMENENIHDAVVSLSDNAQGDRFIQLFAASKEKITSDEMRSWLLSKIPDYMVPSQIFIMDDLPMTQNGKFDKKAAEALCDKAQESFAEAETEQQKYLLKVWQDILGINEIGIDSSFFELGGDSIKAMNLSAVLQRNGINISLKDIFEYPTIRLMSTICSRKRQTPLTDDEIVGETSIVSVQNWFFQNVKEDVSWFNQSVMLELKNDIEKDIICRAWNVLVERHDVLRSIFSYNDNGLNQKIMEIGFCPYEYSEYNTDSEVSDEALIEFGEKRCSYIKCCGHEYT